MYCLSLSLKLHSNEAGDLVERFNSATSNTWTQSRKNLENNAFSENVAGYLSVSVGDYEG